MKAQGLLLVASPAAGTICCTSSQNQHARLYLLRDQATSCHYAARVHTPLPISGHWPAQLQWADDVKRPIVHWQAVHQQGSVEALNVLLDQYRFLDGSSQCHPDKEVGAGHGAVEIAKAERTYIRTWRSCYVQHADGVVDAALLLVSEAVGVPGVAGSTVQVCVCRICATMNQDSKESRALLARMLPDGSVFQHHGQQVRVYPTTTLPLVQAVTQRLLQKDCDVTVEAIWRMRMDEELRLCSLAPLLVVPGNNYCSLCAYLPLPTPNYKTITC
ncbi:unnamed protein product [Symbiodinium natans]|uniref:Uncharacterized protein n=1 Tax=Symbiodinium natans TaxID=878477 RepID=A0A812ID72_9DINO|nr:unnamed protein product [Symbiodinium natans]